MKFFISLPYIGAAPGTPSAFFFDVMLTLMLDTEPELPLSMCTCRPGVSASVGVVAAAASYASYFWPVQIIDVWCVAFVSRITVL